MSNEPNAHWELELEEAATEQDGRVRATSSFEVSEMEMVKQNDLPERREVGAANHQVSTDPRTLQSALCAQPLTCGACPIVALSFEPSC